MTAPVTIVQGFQPPDRNSDGLWWIQKDPDDIKDYKRNWAAAPPDGPLLDTANNEHIASATWSITGPKFATLTSDPENLVVGTDGTPSAPDYRPTHDTTTTTVWLEAGKPGASYNVTCHIKTDAVPPREVDSSFQVRVLQR